MPDLPITAEESPLKFPCAFPIKVMGRTQDGFAQAIVAVVQKHAPDFDAAALEMRASREGNYLSVTATINVSPGRNSMLYFPRFLPCSKSL